MDGGAARPARIRVTLIDSGYVDPDDRAAEIVLQGVEGVACRDILSWYFGQAQVAQLDSSFREFGAMLNEKAGRHILLALAEWNIGSQMQKNMSRFEHDLAIAEAAARFVDAGVEMSEYWPARMKPGNYTLIDIKDNSLTETGTMFSLLAHNTLARRGDATTAL